jgi:hypothetical protein
MLLSNKGQSEIIQKNIFLPFNDCVEYDIRSLVQPVSSASSERSFSAMLRVKICLRATMGDERLSWNET